MKMRTYYKIVIPIVVALLIPVISYTTYQFIQRNNEEELIRSIYERQLETILFSVNQSCWDEFNSWVSVLADVMRSSKEALSELRMRTVFTNFVDEYTYIAASFIRITEENIQFFAGEQDRRDSRIRETFDQNMVVRINRVIQEYEIEIERITRRAERGYVQPFAVKWDSGPTEMKTLLIFPIFSRDIQAQVLAGMIINDDSFVAEVIVPKLNEMEDNNFIFAVNQQDKGLLYHTEDDDPQSSRYEKRETLWILPNITLLVRLRGTTLQALSRTKIRTNLMFLVAMNVMIVFGVVFLLKGIFAEMKLTKLKTDFVDNVTHELRTPLALIRMYAETLEMDRVSSEKKQMHYYKMISSESERLTHIVNNMLDFSRIESGMKEYKFEYSDLSSIVRQTLKQYKYHLKQHNCRLELSINCHSCMVFLDEEAVIRAFINLLDNAVKFSSDKKRILVSLDEEHDNVVLSVEDFGVGISVSDLKMIFEKFYRVESHMGNSTHGSGLGLSIVKHIMDMHGGKVTVTSKPGKGSTFNLIFPKSHSRR